MAQNRGVNRWRNATLGSEIDLYSRRIERPIAADDGSYAVALTEFGFIVTGNGFDPQKDTSVMQTASFRMRTIGVATPDQGVEAAKRLVADGVQLIELCGGFGPLWTGRIIEAIDDAVPIGSVGYGPEAVDRVHEIFAT